MNAAQDSETLPPAGPDQELVTVARFVESTAANFARSALEDAGIPALLRSANANSMLPFAFEAELQVPAPNETAARALLERMEDDPASEAEVLAAEQDEEAVEARAASLPGQSSED